METRKTHSPKGQDTDVSTTLCGIRAGRIFGVVGMVFVKRLLSKLRHGGGFETIKALSFLES
jgi:hypothetical protein